MDEFLNQDELAFLTGRTKKSAQIRWLTNWGYRSSVFSFAIYAPKRQQT